METRSDVTDGHRFRGRARPGSVPPGGLEPSEGETLDYIAGHFRIFQLARGHRFSTDDVLTVYLQEVRGADATARVEFLDAAGTVLDVLTNRGLPAFGTTILGQALVPEGSVTARVTNTGAGAVVAFATPVDRASNDTWVVADWNQVYGFAGTEGQFVAVARHRDGTRRTSRRISRSTPAPRERRDNKGHNTIRVTHWAPMSIGTQK